MMYNGHGWASEWGAMETDGPVVGCPMQADRLVDGKRMGRGRVAKGRTALNDVIEAWCLQPGNNAAVLKIVRLNSPSCVW
jgi:hypothetical protein